MIQLRNNFTKFALIAFVFLTVNSYSQGLDGSKDKDSDKKKSSSSSTFSSEYDWGVGLRVGDFSGVTIKKYNGNNAWELSLGRSHILGRGGKYWDSKYYNLWKDNYILSSYDKWDYLGYSKSNPIGVQLHYLWLKNISDLDGLSWYYGIGGQASFQTIKYSYRYKNKGSDWIYDNSQSRMDMDLGVDGVVGLEYAFKDAPITLFLDATLSMELYDSPFVFWYQGGFGARYNF